ncbi:cytochrome P450 [Xylariales sp. PMI_506]|nr:cytochrome P450 [Xylariales sp. PMI_506]
MPPLLLNILWAWLVLAGGTTLYWGACLFRNYTKARRIGASVGVPTRIIPIDHMNPLWAVLDRKIVPIVKKLPFGLGDNSFTRYNWRGFEREDKTRSHDEMGDAFIMVSPSYIWLYVNDPDTVMDCLRRKNDFKHPIMMTAMLGIFGTNLSVVEGQEWKVHRRITASCFNDQNNQIVWSEALTLATDMLQYWTSKPSVTSTADDTRTLSLHIMTRAGFGKSFKFVGHDEQLENSKAVSYKNSLQTILEDCILIMVLGRKFISKPWLPRKLRNLHAACTDFQAHMTEMYEAEKRTLAAGQGSGGGDRNLMTQLVRASQDYEGEGRGGGGGGLTENEIYGNMFVFNFAGHDTTTHTLTFLLFHLAAHPDVQAWLREEIRAVVGDESDPSRWDLATTFPRLRRCLAVLMETLRLFPPVGSAKWTDDATTTLKVHGGRDTVVLPPQTIVISNFGDLHVNPKYYGPDPLVWRPDRWIKPGGQPGDEELLQPRRGTFLSWSDGPRDCPGRKFSQVEVVGALAVLFLNARVDPLTEKGETLDAARERVMRFIEADATHVLLLQLAHPETVPLVWTKL